MILVPAFVSDSPRRIASNLTSRQGSDSHGSGCTSQSNFLICGRIDAPPDHAWNAVGMIRLATASAKRLAAVCATTGLKCCSRRLTPPKKKHMPMTSSRFDSILPISDVWTISTSLSTKAIMATINSTALLLLSVGVVSGFQTIEHLPE